MPSAEKILASHMRRVSLDDTGTANRNKPLVSLEHENYLPMAQGVRMELWQEGYQQRCQRKKNGFNHFKLEWTVPTDRSVGRRRKAPTLGLRPRYYSARNDTSDRRLEALNLPPTKVEEKRSKLQRLYERKEKKRAENLLRQAKEKEDAMGHPEPLHKVSDYEKNKLKIAKSNIQFELPTCGSLSTDRSTQPTATQRGTK